MGNYRKATVDEIGSMFADEGCEVIALSEPLRIGTMATCLGSTAILPARRQQSGWAFRGGFGGKAEVAG